MFALKHKLIVTIVKKGCAKKVVKASKKAGAEGGTILYGRGIGVNEKTIFGLELENIKEIVLTLVQEDITDSVLTEIVDAVDLNKRGNGIGFVLHTKRMLGICHMSQEGNMNHSLKAEGVNRMSEKIQYDLVISIVNRGDSDLVVEASKKTGATGGTIISGRGTGIHEQLKLFNIDIQPEKEIVLTLIHKEKSEAVLQKICEEAQLNTPGKGIAFVLDVDKVVGITNLLTKK
ncbi:P-II family nitrogen regulator [Bacillus aquiflavi]|uniref:P-II family nitrogen regulator n=1 Tax=Bacillus aquiflavi TaxID=2672567 RepID=UPI001CAA4123|nr:P-II family nitrogen regulator [Bacillus aquiflavi]UAC47761.1 P-II family nitrogen regulator [Bacillus aquiflavi]